MSYIYSPVTARERHIESVLIDNNYEPEDVHFKAPSFLPTISDNYRYIRIAYWLKLPEPVYRQISQFVVEELFGYDTDGTELWRYRFRSDFVESNLKVTI
jgi:hypothetical protein